MTYNEWIEQTKLENPELSEFINKLEGFISDSGLNVPKFEKAVETGLKKIDEDILKNLNQTAGDEN